MQAASKSSSSRARWMWTVGRDVVVRGVFGQVPRTIYGNDAGFLNNYRSRRELAKLASTSPAPPVDVDAEDLAFLKAQGFVELGVPHDKALLDTVHRKYQQLIADPAASRALGQGLKEGQRVVLDPVRRIPEIMNLLNPEIQAVFTSLFGTHLKVDHVRAWRNASLPSSHENRDVYSNLWHNDEFSTNTYRVFVYLTDGVDRDTGAFRCHPIPSTSEIVRSGYLRRSIILGKAKHMIEDPARIVYVEGGIGTTFIANPQLCLHRAGVPRPGTHRDVVQFTVSPSDAPLSADWPASLCVDEFLGM